MKRPGKEYGSRHIHEDVPDSVRTVTLMVGTAGHVDHGKTQLVKLLTGCETDRFPEEKARGMTIDLGFATCMLPGDRRVGIIDVPGHERFVHNMVAGASGVDVVLLVIAADDGVMPQTVEHFHILRMLGVRHGFIAITKIDLVSRERVEEVKQQAAQLVAGSFLDGCAIVPISSLTAAGFDEFYTVFSATVDRTVEREASGPFRLHIERSFVLQGRGTIVTGVPRSGSVRVGDSLELLPGRVSVRVRSIQVYGKDAREGRAGECIAMNLAGLENEDVTRGAVLATPGYFETTTLVDAHFQLLPHAGRPLEPRTAVRFHVGTSDVPGHLVLPELTPLPPGGECYVQVQAQAPVIAAPGDPFIVRLLSPAITVGGGTVVTPDHKRIRRRARDEWVSGLKAHEQAFRDPTSAIDYVCSRADPVPLRSLEIAQRASLTPEGAQGAIEGLVTDGKLIALPQGRYIHACHLGPVEQSILDALNALHDQRPLSLGFGKREVLKGSSYDRSLRDAALDRLATEGRVAVDDSGLTIPSRRPALTAKQTACAERILDMYNEAGFVTPRRDELQERLGMPQKLIDPIVDLLLQKGELVDLGSHAILHRERLSEAQDKVVDHIRQNGSIALGPFRDLLGTTRKFAVPILEYFDAQKLTRRKGNERVLHERLQEAE